MNPLTHHDCMCCGACCCNSAENLAENFRDYVEVSERERGLFKNPDLLRRYTVTNEAGDRHLKLVGDEQRCAALRGALGRRVTCVIYTHRPEGCHRVMPGDAACLARRSERGLDRS